jgi:N-acetylneuraminic acid mutarotase
MEASRRSGHLLLTASSRITKNGDRTQILIGFNAPKEQEVMMRSIVKSLSVRRTFSVFLFCLLFAAGKAAQGQEAAPATSPFTVINVSSAGTGTHQGTVATAINAAGNVAGIYIDPSGNEHAFVLPAGGAITPFNASGTGGSQIFTIPIGLDTAGDIAGVYRDASDRVHGFLRAASNGAISILDVPGEDTGKMEGTYPICINGSGEIAGDYSSTVATSSGNHSIVHGFIRSAGGTISTFDAVPLPTSYGNTNPGTYVVSLNASGEVAGFYIDGNAASHGFLRTASGAITVFEAPNASSYSDQGTAVTGMDAAGDVIGAYADANNIIHGFVRAASNGAITVIDAPGAGTGTYQGTYPDAIDAAGDISGSFTDGNNVVHGFVLPENGAILTYDAPGSSAAVGALAGKGDKLDNKVRGLGKSLSPLLRPKRTNRPLDKFKSLLGKVGAVNVEGAGLLGGSGANPSGTASYGNLLLNGVNPSGEIVGLFTDGDYVFHGYLRAVNGAITTIDAPNAGTNQEQGTGGLAINTSGTIVGAYADTNAVLHGFIYQSASLTATTTTLTPAPTPNPSVFGEPVTITATVSAGSGTPPNGEFVYFMSGAIQLGMEALSGGVASLTTTDLPVGTDSITAVYGGDLNFSGSTSAAASQTVTKASSHTTLASSVNPSSFGQLVTLTATVSGQFGGTATGTVTFSNGSTALGTAPLSGNTAVLPFTALPQGTDPITAVYSGDSNFAGGTSNTLDQVVTAEAGNDWTWMSGSKTVTCGASGCGQPGVYGTPGEPAAGNVPGGRQGAVTWTDQSGNLWLFGGTGFDVNGNQGDLNDLWEFNPSSNEWAWMGGSKTEGQTGVYGTLGTPAAGNIPGGRSLAVSWTDNSGHFWLFGGQGYSTSARSIFLNDVWEFNPSTKEWAWMGGSNTVSCALPSPDYCGQSGTYGTLGTPAAANIPGGRYSATAATDSRGNFWLFGGYGYGAGGACCYLSDLWEFSPSTNQWTWMSGDSGGVGAGVYGTLGTPAVGNMPGSRYYANSWIDDSSHLWLLGGYGFDSTGTGGYLDDLWEFNFSTHEWTWMEGGKTATCWAGESCPQTAVYGTLGVPASGNLPGDRSGASSWIDGSGNLWLFGSLIWHSNGSGSYIFNYLNDLWEFNPSTNEWAWMSGSSTVPCNPNGQCGQRGVYGTLGTSAAADAPGGRYFASSWTDSIGNLWLFGGFGYDSNGFQGNLNDLWKYQPLTSAALTSPTKGAALCGSTTFKWTPGIGVAAYWLYLGTTGQGSSNLYSSGSTTALSESVNVPCDGVTLYAEFLQRINGIWQASYYTYTEGGTLVKAAITSPKPGSVLTGTSATFTWTAGSGPTAYWLYLGTTGVGSSNLFSSGSTTALSVNVTGLPTNDVTVYARFLQRIDGAWQSADYIYGGGGPLSAVLTSPKPGTVLGPSAAFTWTTGAGVTAYWLYLGTTGVGSTDLHTSGSTTAVSTAAITLPTNGVTIFARLMSRINGAWVSADYTFTEGGKLVVAAITSPANKSVLPGPSVKFSWAGGAGPSAYWLYLGTTGVGSSNLYNSGSTTATSATVTDLPTTGVTVYAKFLQRIDGAWQTSYYTYTAYTGTIEKVAFTGTATCGTGFKYQECSSGGPVTGSYSLDVTRQTIVGAWSFTTPYGVISSGMTGSSASVGTQTLSNGLDVYALFQVSTPTFFEDLALYFPAPNNDQRGVVYSPGLPIFGSGICQNVPGYSSPGCEPDVALEGSTATTPEP